MDNTQKAAEGLSALLARTVETLQSSQANSEALATVKAPRGIAVFKTAASMVPVGRAWRLGTLLLDAAARLYSVGEITRAIEPPPITNHVSSGADHRRADRRTASRGPFAVGDVVNFNYSEIATDEKSLRDGSGRLSLIDGVVMLRWNPIGSGVTPLESYLAERIALLGAD